MLQLEFCTVSEEEEIFHVITQILRVVVALLLWYVYRRAER